MPVNPKTAKEFDKWGKKPPTSTEHGTEEDIASKLVELRPNEWTLKGNQLTGMTDVGPLVQYIPTNYILTGTDDEGLPVFKKIA